MIGPNLYTFFLQQSPDEFALYRCQGGNFFGDIIHCVVLSALSFSNPEAILDSAAGPSDCSLQASRSTFVARVDKRASNETQARAPFSFVLEKKGSRRFHVVTHYAVFL